MSSSRGADSASDAEGSRGSSDLDSMLGNGRSMWGLNRSSTSLVGDSIAEEGIETSYSSHQDIGQSPLIALTKARIQDLSTKRSAPTLSRLQPPRSLSSSSVPRWKGEGDELDKLSAPNLHSPRSSQSSRTFRKGGGGYIPPSIGQAPEAPLPPIPKSAPPGNAKMNGQFQAQRASFYPMNNGMSNDIQSNETDRTPFKVNKRWRRSTMTDDEVETLPDQRREQVDLYHFLQNSGEEMTGSGASNYGSRQASLQDSLTVPGTQRRGPLRKSRSQNSFRLNRRPSFLGGSKQADSAQGENGEVHRIGSHSSIGDAENSQRSSPRVLQPKLNGQEISSRSVSSSSPLASRSKKYPWEKLFSSRLDMTDSSPEQERVQPFFASSDNSRGSSLSVSSNERRLSSNGSASNVSKKNTVSTSTASSRPVSPLVESRLDSRGGASNLFGSSSSTPRQRASSLLPSINWRPRTASTVDGNSSPFNRTFSTPEQVEVEKLTTMKVDTTQFEGDAEAFVNHVLANVSRADVSAVLASSGDEIHKQALNIFMQQFYFTGNPLDIALRKLLMSLCLPKETQQIDRVMEAFAQRYNECNERLFSSNDQPYVLAFSLMMLHTDAFNKNAKQKMTKQDYIRNTASSGVPAEILAYLYDNLTFTQFIYVDDDEALSRRKSESEGSKTGSFLSAFSSNNSSSSKNRIDPYYIIATGKTHTLRAEIGNIIAEDSPFSAKGTSSSYDIEDLNRTFVNAPSIEIVTTRRPSIPAAAALGADTLTTSFSTPDREQESVVTLRVTKVGCVSRKDDIVDENKKAQSRKWRTCGMVLSSSQLLFFKDLVWTSALNQQIREQTMQNPNAEGGILITPRITYFRPDGVLALGDAIAMRDTSYTKYNHVFRLIARQGEQSRQYLIQTANEVELNDWIHKINFCAAFRASGLRIRDLDPPSSPPLDAGSPRSLSFSTFQPSQDGEVLTDKILSSPSSSPGLSIIEGSVAPGLPLIGLMRRKLNMRRKEVVPRLEAVSKRYAQCTGELEEILRFAKHLGILTPFMKVTRDRIELTAISLSLRIRQLRLDVEKYGSRKEMLELELEAGDRAARATAPADSFVEVRKGSNGELKSSTPLLPLPMLDIKSSTFHHGEGKYEIVNEEEMPTPKVHTIPIGEERRRVAPHRSLSPASFLRQQQQQHQQMDSFISQSPSTASSISTEPSLDDILGQVINVTSTSFDDEMDASQSAGGSSKSRPLSRRFKSPPLREEAERWDRSRVVKDSKRVSLVTLPDAEHLLDLSRMSLIHANGVTFEEHDE